MKKELKKVMIVSVIVLILTLIFCGCTGTEVEENKTNVFFESELVDLLESNLEFNKNNNNEINQAIITGRIKNTQNRQLTIELKGEFFDKDNNYLGEETFTIVGLRKMGSPGDSTTFTITYEGKNTKFVDYARVKAVETS